MANENDWLPLIRRVSLFSSLTEKELGIILSKMTLASFPKGATLVSEQSSGDTFYLIVSGSARLVKGHPEGTSQNQAENVIAYVSRGDALGEMSLLTGEAYAYSAYVESTADALILKKSDFDEILEAYPKLAIHVTRNFHGQLASLKHPNNNTFSPGRLYSMIPAVPFRDQILFSVNLGISLAEQTREKTLLVMVDNEGHVGAKSLGLDPAPIGSEQLDNGSFRDKTKLDELIRVHSSGLEVLSIPKDVFLSFDSSTLVVLINLLKELYDFSLVVLPSEFNETLFTFIKESNQIIFVSSSSSTNQDLETLRRAEQALPPHKPKDRIWLDLGQNGVPQNIPPGNKIHWDANWGRQFVASGSPFLASEANLTKRKIDRFARYLGGRLIGLAMGSGAAFGYSIIGMLRVLEREGIYVDVVSGTSMGAVIGSFYAMGKSPDELQEIALSITRKRLFKMANFTFPRSGLLTGRGVLKFLRSVLGDVTFNDLEIPFACVATDIQSGREIVLDEGNVAESVRASLSLPIYFKPYYLKGRYLVDGGLVNPVPNSIIMSQGANILLSANLTTKSEQRPTAEMGWRRRLRHLFRGPSILKILLKTIYTMQFEIAEQRAKLAHVVLDINAHGLWWWDLDQADKIIKYGEAAAEENLPKIKSLLPYFSDSCDIRVPRRGRKIY